MGAKAKVFCGLILFFIVFGLRFFCANCQRYPPQSQQQQLQMQKFQQQLQAVTIPIQKDLLSTENRLQSQVLRPGASLIVADTTASGGGQKEYYTDWSHIDNTKPEQQNISQQQRRPGKNCKRKRRPQPIVSTTESPPLIPQEQYWRGHVEDEQPRGRQRHQSAEAIPTQISERIREPSTTALSERIGEALPSRASEIVQPPSPSPIPDRNKDALPLGYSDIVQRPLPSVYSEKYREFNPTKESLIARPLPTIFSDKIREFNPTKEALIARPVPTIYSEKIREFNPTKESLIARQPITTTVFDKIPETSPTRILERNRETFSTKPSDQILPEVSPSRVYERIREPASKKTYERSRDPLPNRNSERIREPLAALEKEQKLFELRDKQRQEFVAEVTAGYRDKSYRRPYSQAKKESTQQTILNKEEPERRSPSPRSPIDLKEILKNSGGLSLSEILQQKNLSLDDLLKGKQNALLALQTTAAAPQKPEANSRERISKPVRRIPQMSSTTTTTSTTTAEPTISDLSEESSEQSGESQEFPSGEIASKESEAVKNFTGIRKNLKFPSRIRMSTTTRRQQQFETTVQQKLSTTTTTIKPTTTRTPLYKKRQHVRPSLMRNPSFKKHDFSSSSESRPSESKEYHESVESQEDSFTSNYPKRSRFRPSSTTTTESILDQTDPVSNFVEDSGENEVLLQSVDVENSSLASENNSKTAVHDQEQSDTKSQEEPTTDHIYRYNSLKNYIDNNLPHAVFMDIDLADIDPVDDRTDLLELIEDRRSGNRLIKVLEQRNMTLEELIEHRKRGSSQLHLATFVQNRSGVFPGKKVVVNDDMDIVTAFENFPHFNLLNLKSVKPDEIKTDSQGSSYFTSIIDIEPTDEVIKDGSGSGAAVTRKNSISNPSSTNIQRQPFYPSWKSLALASLTTAENARRFLQRPDPEPPQQTAQRHQSTVIEEDPVLQIEHEVAQAHDLVDLELSGHGFKRSAMNLVHTSQMPPGIRSAIVASAAIVLTSLVTFMVIFVACRWKQRRRRRKLDYMDTYNALKSKIPVISSRRTDELVTSTTSLGVDIAPSRVSRSNSRQSQHHQISIIIPGGGAYQSAASLSTPSSKLNTMDPNSPEVQDYLFDLRKSF